MIIKNKKHLIKEIKKGNFEYFVQLKHGIRSSKYIDYFDNKFIIINYIDDTEEELEKKDFKESVLQYYINNKALYKG